VAAIDPTAIGQGVLGALVVAGYVIQKRKAEKIESKTDQIHVLVNNRMTEALQRIESLEGSLSLTAGEQLKPGSTVTVTQEQPVLETQTPQVSPQSTPPNVPQN
jgi:hypothetical protein